VGFLQSSRTLARHLVGSEGYEVLDRWGLSAAGTANTFGDRRGS